jgi:hypothetical protein
MNITSTIARPSNVFEQLAAGDRFVPLPGQASVGVKLPVLPAVTYPWRATGTINAADAAGVDWNEVPAPGEPTQLNAHLGLRNLGNGQMLVTFTPTGFPNVQLPSINQPMQIIEQTPTHLALRGGVGSYVTVDFRRAKFGERSPVPIGPKDAFKGTMSIHLGAGGGFGPTVTMDKTGVVLAHRR